MASHSKAVTGTTDYHETMREIALAAYRKQAGYVPPQDIVADITVTVSMSRTYLAKYICTNIVFSEPVCMMCCGKLNRFYKMDWQTMYFDSGDVSDFGGQTCICCNREWDNIPF